MMPFFSPEVEDETAMMTSFEVTYRPIQDNGYLWQVSNTGVHVLKPIGNQLCRLPSSGQKPHASSLNPHLPH